MKVQGNIAWPVGFDTGFDHRYSEFILLHKRMNYSQGGALKFCAANEQARETRRNKQQLHGDLTKSIGEFKKVSLPRLALYFRVATVHKEYRKYSHGVTRDL